MIRWGLLLGLLLSLAALPARAAEPPLRVDLAAYAGELTREPPFNRFTLTIAVFSSTPTTTTVTIAQTYDATRFTLLTVNAVRGTITTSAGNVAWAGELGEKPLTLNLQMQVLPNAPAGLAELRATGRSAFGFSADSVTMRVCCHVWPAATFGRRPLYLPVLRR